MNFRDDVLILFSFAELSFPMNDTSNQNPFGPFSCLLLDHQESYFNLIWENGKALLTPPKGNLQLTKGVQRLVNELYVVGRQQSSFAIKFAFPPIATSIVNG